MPPTPPELAWILLPALTMIGALVWRHRRRGDEGELGCLAAERRVVELLEPLEREGWHVFHDLHLPRADGRGTTHLDHVVVGEAGVFVIETRAASGPVTGCRYDRWWTRVSGGREERFPNPMFEASRRVEALALWLRLPPNCLRGAVFLVGQPERSKDTPSSVVTDHHAGWLRTRQGECLSLVEVMRVAGQLERLKRQKLTLLHALRLNGAEEAATAGDYLSLGVVRVSESDGLRA